MNSGLVGDRGTWPHATGIGEDGSPRTSKMRATPGSPGEVSGGAGTNPLVQSTDKFGWLLMGIQYRSSLDGFRTTMEYSEVNGIMEFATGKLSN